MSEPSKKQSFLQGTVWLAFAAAVVKVIGAFYKLPLNMAIGAEGYSYFTTAYDIYAVLLLVSTECEHCSYVGKLILDNLVIGFEITDFSDSSINLLVTISLLWFPISSRGM